MTTAGRCPGENTLASRGRRVLISCNRCQGTSSNSARTADDSRSAIPNTGSTTKENLRLTGRFLLTLVTKAANTADSNPAKVALGLVKAIIEIKNVRRHSSRHVLTDRYFRP